MTEKETNASSNYEEDVRRALGDNSHASFDGKKEHARIHRFGNSGVKHISEAREMAAWFLSYAMTPKAQGNAEHLTAFYRVLLPAYQRTLARWVPQCSPFYLKKSKRVYIDPKTNEEKTETLVRFARNKKSPYLHSINLDVFMVPFDQYKPPAKVSLFDMVKRLKSIEAKIGKELDEIGEDAPEEVKAYLTKVAKMAEPLHNLIVEAEKEVGERSKPPAKAEIIRKEAGSAEVSATKAA